MAAATATINPQAADNVATPSNTSTGAHQREGSSFNRPQSGCSNYIDRPTTETTPTEIKKSREADAASGDSQLSLSKTSSSPARDPVLLVQTDESSYERLEAKLSDLELDIALECLLDEPLSGIECNSRSSKSSSCGEEEKKISCDTNK